MSNMLAGWFVMIGLIIAGNRIADAIDRLAITQCVGSASFDDAQLARCERNLKTYKEWT